MSDNFHISHLILPPDKTTNFYIEDLPNVYVRTGVIGDGSCFFHSYLRAFDTGYRNKNTASRTEAVLRLRETLAESVSLETFKVISNGEYRKMLFFRILRYLFEKSVNQLLSSEELVDILEHTTTFETNFYSEFINSVLQRASTTHTRDKMLNFIQYLKQLFIEANDISIEHFKQALLHSEIGSTEVEFVARKIECNFIFLFTKEGKVELYPFSAIVDESWPYCVILWVGESHYEVIGRKEDDRTIVRKFYKDDEIIQKYTKE